MCGKSPATTTTNNITSNTPPPQVLAQYQNVVNSANQVAQTPYSAYGGQYVAPINSQENAGIGGINQYANAAQPTLGAAASGTLGAIGATQNAAQPISAAQIANYQSPYTQSVVNATEAEFGNQNQQQAQSLNSNAIGAGAFGGDRAGIAQGNLANQQSLAEAPTIAALYNQGYSQALGEANTEQQAGLQGASQELSGFTNLGNIGVAAQTAGLQGANEQVQAGSLQQQTQQAEDTALYNQYLQQQAYPFQTTGWLANISEGIGSQEGGTSTSTGQTTAPGPSALGTGIGAATAGLGILSSLPGAKRGGRVEADDRENIQPIGKSFDGKTIYKFNFRGDPRTHVGLISHKMMVNQREHRQIGGNIGGGVGGGVFTSPTTPFQPTGAPYANVMGYVPPSQAMSIGHTMPTSAGQPPAAAQSQGQPTAAQMGAFGTAIGKGGLQAYNALNGDAIFNNEITDAAASGEALGTPDFSSLDDTDFELARGGHVRDRFQTGGTSAYSAINPLYSQLEAPVIDAKTGEKVYNGLTNNYTSPFAFGGGVRGAFDDGGSILDSAFGPGTSAYAPTPAPPIQTAANASGLANLVGKLESGNGANVAAQPAGMADKIYGQYPAFVQQYGDGPTGIANYAQKTLAAKPDATLGDFYAGYVLNTANPGGHSFAELENTNVPGAQGAAYNLLKNSGYSPDTPLAAVMGGATGAGGSGGYTSPYSAAMAGAPPPQSPYSANLQNQGQEKGLLGLPKDLAGPLMAAGFGMMASRSPWAGVAIGEGGQAGLQYYQKDRDLKREIAQTQATIDNSESEAAFHNAQVKMLNLQTAYYQNALGVKTAPMPSELPGSTPAPALASAPGTPVEGVPAVPAPRAALAAPAPTGIAGSTAMTAGLPVGSGSQLSGNPTPTASPAGAVVALSAAQPKLGAPNVPASAVQTARAMAPSAPQGAQTVALGSAPPPAAPQTPAQALPQPTANPVWQDPMVRYWYQQMAQAKNADPYMMLQGTEPTFRNAGMQFDRAVQVATQTPQYRAAVAGQEEQARLGAQFSPAVTQQKAIQEAQIAGQEAQARLPAETTEITDAQGNKHTVFKSSLAGAPGGEQAVQAGNTAELAPWQTEQQKSLWAQHNEMGTQMVQRQQLENRLGLMQGIMQNFQTGKWADEKANITAALRSIGVPVPDTVTANPAAFQAFMKDQTQTIFEQVKAMGNRPLVAEIQGFRAGNPGPELQPAANAAMLSQAIGTAKWQDKYAQDWRAWHSQNPGAYDDSTFQNDWVKANPIEKFITPESKNFAYKGQFVPPAAERLNGQHYMTPKGEYVWSKTDGWQAPPKGGP